MNEFLLDVISYLNDVRMQLEEYQATMEDRIDSDFEGIFYLENCISSLEIGEMELSALERAIRPTDEKPTP